MASRKYNIPGNAAEPRWQLNLFNGALPPPTASVNGRKIRGGRRLHGGRKLIDLTGRRFGRLLVIERAPKNWYGNSVGWKCDCDCGVSRIVMSGNLRSGATKSCGGCGVKQTRIIDLVGRRFGKLTVIRRAANNSRSRRRPRWDCLCDCGKTTNVDGGRLHQGATKSCGCYRFRRGEDHHAWKGGQKAWNRRGVLKKYGLTFDSFNELLESQGNACAICGNADPVARHGTQWAVDHNHKTSLTRGILCHNCNTGIGLLGDSAETMKSAMEYLNKYALEGAPILGQDAGVGGADQVVLEG